MSKRRNDDLFDTLSETKRLVGDLDVPTGGEFSLESILAEFGQSAAEPAPKQGTIPVQEELPAEEVPQEAPAEEIAAPVEAETELSVEEPLEEDVISEEAEPVEEARPAEEEAAPAEQEESVRPRAKILQFPGFFHREEQEESVEEQAPVQEESVSAAEQRQPQEEVISREQRISLEAVMSHTVNAVLEENEEDEEREPLRERIGFWWANVKEKAGELAERIRPAEKREAGRREIPLPPEPDMEQAVRECRRYCKRLSKQLLLVLLPLVPLLAVTVIHTWWPQILPTLWHQTVLLRCGVMGGLLLVACLLCPVLWRRMVGELKERRVGCEVAAALSALAVLGDCIYGAATNRLYGELPLAAPVALLVWLCLLGRLLAAQAQLDAFRLADMGGEPPYGVTIHKSGACKQQGRIEGFYHTSRRADPAKTSQTVLLPLLLSAATVLAGVVCIGGDRMEEFLWVWSAMLTASLSLGLPLCGALSVRCLNRRLSRSGCAVAGYTGARSVSHTRRIVVTDNDIFPPGMVTLNGLKIYGEEIGKVLSYAATVAKAAESQLQPIFEQLLASEGGTYCPYEDLHFYEDGGVGITVQGESITMGSEYFMRKRKVTLPRELKVKTGVFLAVDGQLIAIFAMKYQASPNVEWALRALRRSRIEPVLAVRSGNITPGMLKRRFGVDAKPVYPDISTRLSLSELSKETVPAADVIIYREGLMPFAEVLVGSRRCCRMVRWSVVLCWLGSLCGLLLGYYLTGVAAYSALGAGYMLVFLLLWLLPAVLLGDLTRRY